MAVLKDTVQATMIFDGKQAVSELNKLQLEQRNLAQSMNDLKLASQEYLKQEQKMKQMAEAGLQNSKSYQKAAEKAQELKKKHEEYTQLVEKNGEVKKKIDQVRESLGTTGMTMTQLVKYQKELDYAFKNSDYGTEKYEQNRKKLIEVSAEIQRQRGELQASKAAWDNEIAMKNILEVNKALGLTGMSVKQLTEYQKQLKTAFENAKPNTAEFAQLEKELREVDKQLEKVNGNLKETPSFFQKIKGQWQDLIIGNAIGNIIGEAALQGLSKLADLFFSAIDGAKKLSDQFADIAKKTGMSATEVEALNKELSKIDTRTSSSDLREIAVVAGGLGVAKDEVAGFVKSIDEVVVAIGDELPGGAEGAAGALGGLKELFKDTVNLKYGEAMTRSAAALNELGNVSKAKAGEVADFASRLGALGNLAPSITETMGLGSALIKLGMSAERASGGVMAILFQAGKADTMAQFGKVMGKTTEEVEKLINTDPNKFLFELAKSMKGLSNTQVVQTLNSLKITSQESATVMGLLANKTDLLREYQDLANKSFEEGTSVSKEFAIKNNNLAGEIEKSEKALQGLVMGVGQGLVPVYAKSLELTVKFLTLLKELPEFLDKNKALWISLAFGLLTYNRAAIATSAQGIATITKALWAKVTAVRAADLSFKALRATMLANPVGLVVLAIYAAVEAFMYFYDNFEGFRRVVNGMLMYWKWQFTKIFEVVWEFAAALGNVARMVGNVFMLSKEGAANAAKAVRENFANLGKSLGNLGEEAGQAWSDGYNRGLGKSTAEYQEKTRLQASQKAGIPKSNAKGNTPEVLDMFDIQTAADNWQDNPEKSQAELKKEDQDKKKSQADQKREKENQDRFKTLGIGDKKEKSNKNHYLDELEKLKEFHAQVEGLEREQAAKKLTIEQEALLGFQKFEVEKTRTVWIEHNQQLLAIDERFLKEKEKISKHQAEIVQNEHLTKQQKSALLEAYNNEALILEDLRFAQIRDKQKEFANEQMRLVLETAQAQAQIEAEKLDAIQEKELEFLEKSIEAAEILKQALMSEDEKEIEQARKKYDELIALAKKYGYDTVELEKRKKQEIQALEAQQTAETIGAMSGAVGEFAGMFGGLHELIGENNEQMAGFMKTVAMFQITVDTAKAISSAIAGATSAAATTGPAAPFVMAGYIAAAVGAVIGAFVQVKKTIGGAEQPKAPKPAAPKFSKGGIAKGASHRHGGIAMIDSLSGKKVGEMEGGEPYMILSTKTYENNQPIIDKLLYNSMHRNGEAIVKPPSAALHQSLKKYALGGIVGTGAGSGTANNTPVSEVNNDPMTALFGQMLAEMRLLNSNFAQFPTTLRAVVLLHDLEEARKKIENPKSKSEI